MRTVEAIIDEHGVVRLLEPIKLSGTRRVLVTILEDDEKPVSLRPHGLAAGDFTVPDNFDDPPKRLQ